MKRAALALLLCLPALAGCDVSMRRQARYDAQAPATLWPDGTASRPIPAGVVAVDEPARAAEIRQPPQVDLALLHRGRDRFDIFCAPCHGAAGHGDGRVVKRGFPAPPDYALPRVKALSGRQVFDVISNGYGVMYPHADRITPADRWAVVAYVRALQTAADQPAAPSTVPLEPRR